MSRRNTGIAAPGMQSAAEVAPSATQLAHPPRRSPAPMQPAMQSATQSATRFATRPVTEVTQRATQFVDVDADGRHLRLEYAWIGDATSAAARTAPLLVFLHEGLGSLAMWRDYPQRLCAATGARGLVYSRAGYGRSTPRTAGERWPVEFLAREADAVLPALLGALQVRESSWLIGHSDGASIALLHAARHPARVAGVVAIAPHLFVEDLSVASIEAARTTYLTTDMKARLARYHDDPDSAFWGWNDIWLDPAFRSWNIESDMRAIGVPVLAVQGEDDEYGTMAQVEAVVRCIPHASLVKLARCGHSPHRDRPDELTAAVRAFLRLSAAGNTAAASVDREPPKRVAERR